MEISRGKSKCVRLKMNLSAAGESMADVTAMREKKEGEKGWGGREGGMLRKGRYDEEMHVKKAQGNTKLNRKGTGSIWQ